MIPLRDNNPTRAAPVVTWLLVAANAVVFALQLSHASGSHLGLMKYAMIPREITSGAQVGAFPHVHPAWITIFTSMFMHGGLLHIGSNMVYLIIFGNNIEDRLGHFKYLFFYLACGVAAGLAHTLSAPDSMVPTLGASGAVAGVLGAYMVLYPGASVICLVWLGFFITTVEIPALIVLGFWIGGQILSARMGSGTQLGGGIAYWAHIGGFFTGIILLFILGGISKHSYSRVRRSW